MSNSVINIYQIFTRLFRNDNATNKQFGTISENGVSKFNDIDELALKELKSFGVTHLWYTGVIRHATCTNYMNAGVPENNHSIVKGQAGSPYAITDYYDVDPDLAVHVNSRMEEFQALVTRTHEAGMKVIIDFVPNHVAREYKSICKPENRKDLGEDDDKSKHFLPQNNFYYFPGYAFELFDAIHFPFKYLSKSYHEFPAKVTGNDAFTPKPSINDWYETIKLNYGIDYLGGRKSNFNPLPNTWMKMLDILLFWAQKGIDAFRCDMAEMVPVEFWHWAIAELKQKYPHILFIAEVYNPAEYHNYINIGGFDFLYDKVGLYDILRSIIEGRESAAKLSNFWKSREGLHNKMIRFLENHDEQRIASNHFAGNALAGVPGMFVSGTMHNCPLMLYFGQEIGEPALDEEGYSGRDGRTTIFDYWSVREYQKWVNGGAFDGALLDNWQNELRDDYSKLLHFRQNCEALRDGGFYDIMYVNNYGNLNLDKIFAYIRHSKNQVLLFVINFDMHHDYTFKLKIPMHALEFLSLPIDANYIAKELLSGNSSITFVPNDADKDGIDVCIKPQSVLMFELVLFTS